MLALDRRSAAVHNSAILCHPLFPAMHNPNHLFDLIPVWGIFAVLILGGFLIFEIGYRIGDLHQRRTPDEKEGSTGLLVGALVGLLALLLAFSVGMASDLFNTRRNLVTTEANSIRTVYLRAGLVEEPYRTAVRELLREYITLQIYSTDAEGMEANLGRTFEIQDQIWQQVELLALEEPGSEMVALFVESVNEMIEVDTQREVTAIYARVPNTILYMLVIGGGLTVGLVGYNAGLTRKRSVTGSIILIVLLAVVITLVFDLDRPRDGLLIVSQSPLEDLLLEIGTPE
jgi:hypothetical protein